MLLASCGGAATPPIDAPELPRDEQAFFQLTFASKPVGVASERFRSSDDGFVLVRREQIRVQRNGTPVESTTTIRITGAAPAAPGRIEWTTESGGQRRTGTARREGDGWAVEVVGAPRRWIAGGALPWELLPWLPPPARAEVILPALDFATGALETRRQGARLEVTITTRAGPLRSIVTLGPGGRWQRVQSGAVQAERTDALQPMPTSAPDILVNSAITAAGTPSQRLELGPIERPAPPAFSGQTVKVEGHRWLVDFSQPVRADAKLLATLSAEIAAVREHEHRDCTAFANALIERLETHGLKASAVTGYRIDSGKLYRHRWVEVIDGHRRIPVDPTYGLAELPRARYLALARHGSSFADVTLTDEVTFAGTTRATASFR